MSDEALKRAVKVLDDWLRVLYEHDTMPGFVVAVAHKDKVIFNKAYGQANLETKEKLTPQHLFRIASHSKTFTSTLVMQLQEQGKLRIDDPIVNYLSWLKDHKDKRWQNVTIRQLLSNGAGVTRDGDDDDFWILDKPFPTRKELKNKIIDSSLSIENNTRLKYSNFGFSLLGLLIEEVSGKTYHDCATENIIKPLGLRNTGPEYDEKLKDKYATGYTRDDFDKKRLPVVNVSTNGMASATGFYSDSEDLCTYFCAHTLNSGKLLSNESKKEMQRLQWLAENVKDKEGYGLGLSIYFVNDRKLIGHGGGFPGNLTASYCDPKSGLVVIVLTNANGLAPAYMAKSIVKFIDYYQDNYDKQDQQLEKYEGVFVDIWAVRRTFAIGGKLLSVGGLNWEPFTAPDELKKVTGDEFRISKTNSWDSGDEMVKFVFGTDGSIEKMNYAGSTKLIEKLYKTKYAGKKRVGQV